MNKKLEQVKVYQVDPDSLVSRENIKLISKLVSIPKIFFNLYKSSNISIVPSESFNVNPFYLIDGFLPQTNTYYMQEKEHPFNLLHLGIHLALHKHNLLVSSEEPDFEGEIMDEIIAKKATFDLIGYYYLMDLNDSNSIVKSDLRHMLKLYNSVYLNIMKNKTILIKNKDDLIEKKKNLSFDFYPSSDLIDAYFDYETSYKLDNDQKLGAAILNLQNMIKVSSLKEYKSSIDFIATLKVLRLSENNVNAFELLQEIKTFSKHQDLFGYCLEKFSGIYLNNPEKH